MTYEDGQKRLVERSPPAQMIGGEGRKPSSHGAASRLNGTVFGKTCNAHFHPSTCICCPRKIRHPQPPKRAIPIARWRRRPRLWAQEGYCKVLRDQALLRLPVQPNKIPWVELEGASCHASDAGVVVASVAWSWA
eukprot:5572919-Pyramimonas_sp.AAC.1